MRRLILSKLRVLAALTAVVLPVALTGCNTDPEPKPIASALPPLAPSTQPVPVVAELAALKISRTDLDQLLYESYGLRMMFDLVELGLAKATLQQQGGTLTPADVQREREITLEGICGDAPKAQYEDLFNQFLQQEHLSRSEFDLKIVQTNAVLRKIIEPLVIGKIPEDKVKRAFEQLYGAKRRIADITLGNVRDATVAHGLLKTEPFAQVAQEMSLDTETRANGGEWPPFSSKSQEIDPVILDAAFSLDPNQVSDILSARNGTFHIIKVVEVIPPNPRIARYEDEKQSVRQELESRLIEADIKRLRQGLIEKAQQQVEIDDPILKAQWDEMVAKSTSQSVDRKSVGQQFDQQRQHAATQPSTMPMGK
jgi:hypothetical protein